MINIQRQLQRQREVEVSFTNLSNFEPQKLAVIDDYVLEGYYFQVLGYEVILKNEELIRSLCHLSDKKREVILLSIQFLHSYSCVDVFVYLCILSNPSLIATPSTACTCGSVAISFGFDLGGCVNKIHSHTRLKECSRKNRSC